MWHSILQERWQALAASCPYPFTILGQGEAWAGDKGVTKNKLMYYLKCASRHDAPGLTLIGICSVFGRLCGHAGGSLRDGGD